MGRRLIEGTDLFYDDEFDVIINSDNLICSTIPYDSFAFEDKLYTYGTKVRIKDTSVYNNPVYLAEFVKSDSDAKGQFIVKTPKALHKKMVFYTTDIYDGRIVKIEFPVYRKSDINHGDVELPPVDNGYRTVESTSDSILGLRYRNHLYNCVTDANGNIENTFAPNTFGYGKHVYTIGTRVLLRVKKSWQNTPIYVIGEYNGCSYAVSKSYPYTGVEYEKNYEQKKRVVGIVEPKYYRPIGHTVTKWEKFKMNGKNPPVDTFAGTIWYILVMVIGTIFKARLMIWIFATLCYILWRFGYLGKK